MNLNMESYYRIIDHYKGEICMLTSNRCDNGDCRQCVFAMGAYKQSLERKKGRVSDDEWYTIFGIKNVPPDVTSPDKPFTFLGQCQHRPEAMECKARNASKFDRVIVVKGTASPADLFEIMEEVD